MVQVTLNIEDKLKLLSKAAQVMESSELTHEELIDLSKLLDMDELFRNFPERELRHYKNPYSGQPIQGVMINRAMSGEVSSFSFIPHHEASRSQLYEGLIFSCINPAARSLNHIIYWLQPSDYAKMSLADAAAWGTLAQTIIKVKDWSKYLDIVGNPGGVIAPLFGGYPTTADLLNLDAVFFSKISSSIDPINLERMETVNFV